MSLLSSYKAAFEQVPFVQKLGRVRYVAGLSVEVEGLSQAVGDLCRIRGEHEEVMAEVVSVSGALSQLMPFSAVDGLSVGCEVVREGRAARIQVGSALLGRVIDGFIRPWDARPAPELQEWRPLRAAPLNPLQRPRVTLPLETGIRAIDGLLTIGRGQRVGIFAGSGVGKSTLLGMIARHVKADVNVIALIGERGREVREFVEKQLGPSGLARSVVVAAPADQPAVSRLRATYAAVAIAEYFRDQGLQVVLTLDSITRFAMARREVGLAAGEPPTARSYTPSVFADLPQLCERCGTSQGGGSITALMTVLVEGDDFNEPVADTMRAVLDGHIVLSRQFAQDGRFPSIDPSQSVSRVMPDIVTPAHQGLARDAVKLLSLLERNRQLIDIGAYQAGTHGELDRALAVQPQLLAWLEQSEGGAPAAEGVAQLASILGGTAS